MTHTTTLTLPRQHAGFLRDAQAVHRTLMHATGGSPHLWGAPDDTHLVIRHPNPVDWAGDLGHRIHQAITTGTTTPTTGTPVRYALIGNPIINEFRQGRRGIKRPAPPEKWAAWLDRRLGEAINLTTIDSTKLRPARGQKHTHRTRHQRVLFTGTGTVKNHDTLARLMESGVGPGKAYGCGLLLVEAA